MPDIFDIGLARDARDQEWDVERLLEILLQEIRTGKIKPKAALVLFSETEDCNGVNYRSAPTGLPSVSGLRLLSLAKGVVVQSLVESVRDIANGRIQVNEGELEGLCHALTCLGPYKERKDGSIQGI